jgi:hypothetical protein
VTASFAPDGAPQPLPERFVPEAYREWGVELFDWQSQCSCNAEGGALRWAGGGRGSASAASWRRALLR